MSHSGHNYSSFETQGSAQIGDQHTYDHSRRDSDTLSFEKHYHTHTHNHYYSSDSEDDHSHSKHTEERSRSRYTYQILNKSPRGPDDDDSGSEDGDVSDGTLSDETQAASNSELEEETGDGDREDNNEESDSPILRDDEQASPTDSNRNGPFVADDEPDEDKNSGACPLCGLDLFNLPRETQAPCDYCYEHKARFERLPDHLLF